MAAIKTKNPADTTLAGHAAQHRPADETENGCLLLYRIEVKSRGSIVAEHLVVATDALTAINLVESEYGEPLDAELVSVETEEGRRQQMLMVKNWHGYTFDARAVDVRAAHR